jgi:hypothetical protein
MSPSAGSRWGNWLKIEGRLFAVILPIYLFSAAVGGKVTAGALVVRFVTAAATALLIGAVYRLRTDRIRRDQEKGKNLAWPLLMGVILAIVVIAFVVSRLT